MDAETASEDILFAGEGALGRVTLNRPRALNALTRDMAEAFHARLDAWAEDPGVAAVVAEGAGERAFCAGGDIRALYRAMTTRGDTLTAEFYRAEYRLNYRIHTFPKPYVALVDGVAMGGGVGLSVHGSHRVLTERTLFAMPETGIGLFPDVGMSHVLAHMPGALGVYLGLTGARLGVADALYIGYGTHYVPSGRLGDLIAALAAEAPAVDAVLARFVADPGPPPLARRRALIDRTFSAPSVIAILDRLVAEDDPWCAEIRALLRSRSPTSLLVTFEAIARGRTLALAETLKMEYRLSQRFCAGHDFREGVRAVVIDKDNAPHWHPPRLEDVSEAMVAAYFPALEAGGLVL